MSNPIPLGGKLVPLNKDGGWKIRWIASPFRLHQHVLEPMSRRLYSLLEQIPWDYTHAQEKAKPLLQKLLAEGKTLHSVDLSSATDQFPLSWQLKVLEQLCPGDRGWNLMISLFETLSRSSWSYDGNEYQWQKGQPMGLRPSFPAFGLSHGVLIHQLSGGKDCFAVLGDDVVIWDDEVHLAYRNLMDRWSVPISESKTISSDKVCEFAGTAIYADATFHCFKWKNFDDNNFLKLMENFGKKYFSRLSPRQKRVYQFVHWLQPPLGLGHGVTDLVASIAATEELVEVKIPRMERYLRFFQWLKNHIPFGSVLSTHYLLKIQNTFDKKVAQAMDRVGLPNFQGDPSIFTQFLSSRGELPRSPSLVSEKVGPSVLVQYEQWLRLGRVRKFYRLRRKNHAKEERGVKCEGQDHQGCNDVDSRSERTHERVSPDEDLTHQSESDLS
jgi:hypothetical protein